MFTDISITVTSWQAVLLALYWINEPNQITKLTISFELVCHRKYIDKLFHDSCIELVFEKIFNYTFKNCNFIFLKGKKLFQWMSTHFCLAKRRDIFYFIMSNFLTYLSIFRIKNYLVFIRNSLKNMKDRLYKINNQKFFFTNIYLDK